MSDKTISERIWAKLWDHHGDLDDDFECIAHDAEALEKQLEGCLAKCRDEANRLLMGISTPISPDDFDKLINEMKQIGK